MLLPGLTHEQLPRDFTITVEKVLFMNSRGNHWVKKWDCARAASVRHILQHHTSTAPVIPADCSSYHYHTCYPCWLQQLSSLPHLLSMLTGGAGHQQLSSLPVTTPPCHTSCRHYLWTLCPVTPDFSAYATNSIQIIYLSWTQVIMASVHILNSLDKQVILVKEIWQRLCTGSK